MPRELQEHRGWQKKHPLGPVTWDGECALCGWRLEDKPMLPGKSEIEGNGRRIARVYSSRMIGGEIYRATQHMLACSVCVPSILDKREE